MSSAMRFAENASEIPITASRNRLRTRICTVAILPKPIPKAKSVAVPGEVLVINGSIQRNLVLHDLVERLSATNENQFAVFAQENLGGFGKRIVIAGGKR